MIDSIGGSTCWCARLPRRRQCQLAVALRVAEESEQAAADVVAKAGHALLESRTRGDNGVEEKGGGSAYNVEYRLQVRDYSRSLVVKLRRVRHVHVHIHVRL